jgi:asparagine synthase (glutamine-hydrolysing)
MPDGGTVHVATVHNRLSIIDTDARSDQPLIRDGLVLAYNGEIYNFRALRSELAAEGAQFTTEGDSEVLLALLIRRGLRGLAGANGMWSITLLDPTAMTLTAARDRYGKKPLFYFRDQETVCLASEMKAIFAYLNIRPGMLQGAIITYLAHGWLFPSPGDTTHFDGVNQVPPGASLTFDLTTWTISPGPRTTLDVTPPTDTGAEALAGTLAAAVTDRLISDRDVGLLLSGGVDSSLILSVLAHAGKAHKVHCFVGDAGKSDDADFARHALAALGLEGRIIPLDYSQTSFDDFLSVCRHQEKPFPLIGNVLGLPQLYRRIAGCGVPVVLDGTGADEIFGGYPERSLPLALAAAWRVGDHDWIETTRRTFAGTHHVASRIGATLDILTRDGSAAVLGQLAPAADPAEPDLSALLSADVRSAPRNDLLTGHVGTFAEALLQDATAGRMQEWLWQNDRTAMQHGIENRSPFLDHRLARWMSTSYRAKIKAPFLKHELRTLFDHFTPLPTQWRAQKQGFRWVYGRFLRANRSRVLDVVAASRVLPRRVDTGALVARARNDDTVLLSEVMQRALCVAALEDQLGMTG